MMTTVQDHDWDRQSQAFSLGPSAAWVQRVADWIGESSAPESWDIARDVDAVAARMVHDSPPAAAVISAAWLARLADWVERDPRQQAADIARQLREWAAALLPPPDLWRV